MNTRALPDCQTGWRALLLAVVWPVVAAVAESPAPPVSPAPTPVWQPELEAAQRVEARLLFTPPATSEEADKRRAALSETYRLLAEKYPDVAAVQKSAGDDSAFNHRPADAMRYWQRAERLDPKDAATAAALGEGSLRLGRARDAYEHFARAVEAAPDVAQYHFDLANVLYLFRQELVTPLALSSEQAGLGLALEHFRRAAELAPKDLRLAQAYAETFYVFAEPDWQQALRAWQTVRALSGEKRDFANSHLARVSLRLGRPEDADGYLAEIHDPAFDPLKQKMAQQAALLRAKPAARH